MCKGDDPTCPAFEVHHRQFVEGKRLAEIIGGPGAHGLYRCRHTGDGGHDHHHQTGIERLDLLQQTQAVFQGSAQTHFAVACKDQFHGNGTMSGVCTSSDKHNVFRHVPYTGTYTVNPDCTGAFTTTDENGIVSHADLFFPPDGAFWSLIFTDAGVVDEVVEQRASRDDRL